MAKTLSKKDLEINVNLSLLKIKDYSLKHFDRVLDLEESIEKIQEEVKEKIEVKKLLLDDLKRLNSKIPEFWFELISEKEIDFKHLIKNNPKIDLDNIEENIENKIKLSKYEKNSIKLESNYEFIFKEVQKALKIVDRKTLSLKEKLSIFLKEILIGSIFLGLVISGLFEVIKWYFGIGC